MSTQNPGQGDSFTPNGSEDRVDPANVPGDPLLGIFGGYIHVYTRSDALRDGTLIAADPALCREAGLVLPLALTATAWAECVAWTADSQTTPDASGQSETGRLWDVLVVARHAAIAHLNASSVRFTVMRVPPTGSSLPPSPVRLELHIGTGDDGEAVLTIMLQGET